MEGVEMSNSLSEQYIIQDAMKSFASLNANSPEPLLGTQASDGGEHSEKGGEASSIADSLNRYYKDLQHLPRLNREQEVHLARQRDVYRKWACAVICKNQAMLTILLDSMLGRETGCNRVEQFHPPYPFAALCSGKRQKIVWLRARFKTIQALSVKLSMLEVLKNMNYMSPRAHRAAVSRLRGRMCKLLDSTGPSSEILSAILRQTLRRSAGSGQFSRRQLSKLNQAANRLQRAIDGMHRIEAEFVVANLRLVISLAKSFCNRGLPISDLLQEGNIGLMKAAERYDYRTRCRFCTYASWWIKQSIVRSLSDQSRIIRLPVHLTQTIHLATRAHQQLFQKNCREPSLEEVGVEIGTDHVQLGQLLNISKNPASLSTPLTEDAEGSLTDVLPDNSQPSPVDCAEAQQRHEQLLKAVAELTERERRVINMRFGLGDEKEKTLEQVGSILGLTRERIRQIEKHALSRLRRLAMRTDLQNFWD